MEPSGRLLSSNRDETLLNLRKNVFYVMLKEGDQPIIGRLIFVNARKTYRPINKTTALLLYLLPCDGEDPILLGNYLDLATANFPGATEEDIIGFLDQLDTTYKILTVTPGTSGSDDPDPMELFGGEFREEWQPPGLELYPAPIVKSNTMFSVQGVVKKPR